MLSRIYKCTQFIFPLVAALFLAFNPGSSIAQGTAFTYQGRLSDSGTPANGTYSLQFKLFDDVATPPGMQQGPTVTPTPVTVTDGIFTVTLDFGAEAFTGADRFLEIAVLSPGVGFTTLSPRQQVTSNPYAIKSLSAATADGLSVACVNCVTSSQINSVSGSQVSGLIPVASVPDLSLSYVQNKTSPPQTTANFNIDGKGTANIFSATTQYDIGATRMLSAPGAFNTFVGRNAGAANTGGNNAFFGDSTGSSNMAGSSNAFFGTNTGQNNTTGSNNAFFGEQAGFGNSAGSNNAFFGESAGRSNAASDNSFFGTLAGADNFSGSFNSFFGKEAGRFNGTGAGNSFFGFQAGFSNTIAISNSFFGNRSGSANTEGGSNAFFGDSSGVSNTNGSQNSFFGFASGINNRTGGDNSFFGHGAGAMNFSGSANTLVGKDAGKRNVSGSLNTLIGQKADVSDFNFTNATAVGANAQVSQSNSLVLGSINTVNQATADTNVGIGTTAPQQRLHVVGDEILSTGSASGFKFRDRGSASASDDWVWYSNGNIARFFRAGIGDLMSIQTNGNVGIGTTNASVKLDVVGSATFRNGANTSSRGLLNLVTSPGGGAELYMQQGATASGIVFRANSASPNAILSIAQDNGGSFQDRVRITQTGTVVIFQRGTGGSIPLCHNASSEISDCSSSIRYKHNINPFVSGLSLIRQLRPVSFNWRANKEADFGLVAEEVNQVEPLLTTTNDKGEIEGVKYDRVGVVLVNAVQEQQAQIESLAKQNRAHQEQIERQQKQIDSLKQLVCTMNPRAGICK